MGRRKDSGDERPTRSWVLMACRDHKGDLWYIGGEWYAKLYSDPLEHQLVQVLVTEWLGPKDDSRVTHYGWEDSDRGFYPEMIRPRTAGPVPWALLDICFTYGMTAAIEEDKGSMTPLIVEEIGNTGEVT